MQVEQAHNSIVICRSCGADYSADLPNCPYCGTMNLPAAESAYMGKLEHMRSNLENLGTLAGSKAKKGFRSLRRKSLLAAVFLLLVVGVIYGISLHRERVEAQREKEEVLWQRGAFARMDECYAAGDYESLLLLYFDAQDAGHHVWQYKHSHFCEFLMDIETARYSLEEYEAGTEDLAWLFLHEIRLYRMEYLPALSEEDRSTLERLRAPLLEDLDARFHLTQEELSAFRKTLARDGFVSYEECSQFLKERGMEQ